MVFLPNLGVNRRSRLCDVASYVSAQELDFLDLVEDPACGEQKSSSVNWKHQKVPMPILPIYGWALMSSSKSYVCLFIFSHSTFDVGRSMFDVLFFAYLFGFQPRIPHIKKTRANPVITPETIPVA